MTRVRFFRLGLREEDVEDVVFEGRLDIGGDTLRNLPAAEETLPALGSTTNLHKSLTHFLLSLIASPSPKYRGSAGRRHVILPRISRDYGAEPFSGMVR